MLIFEEQRMKHPESPSGEERVSRDLSELLHANDPATCLDRQRLSEAEVSEIAQLMNALARLRDAERALDEASRASLGLSVQEMRALRYLAAAAGRGDLVTPSRLAEGLGISPASTTKLLNRLERSGHISRELHPVDRRAIRIRVTPSTEALVRRSAGRQNARRATAAARLTQAERSAVTEFLDEISDGIDADRLAWARSGRGLDAALDGAGSETSDEDGVRGR